MTRLILIGVLLLALVVTSCGSGAVVPPLTVGQIVAVRGAGGEGVLWGPPGTADPATEVHIDGSSVAGTALADGSCRLRLDSLPGTMIVRYLRGGVQRQAAITSTTLDARVAPRLCSTGSGPNDMLYYGGWLFVANALDNAVTRYTLAGEGAGQFGLPQAASPSYLGVGADGFLAVVCNGSNTVVPLDASSLARVYLPDLDYTLSDPGIAFPGPSQPIVVGRDVFLPCSEIATFAPTSYAPGKLRWLDYTPAPGAPAEAHDFTTTGLNPQFTAYDAQSQRLFVVSSGDIQFDEDFVPHAESDSYLDVYSFAGEALVHEDALNLGLIGAGRITLSPDGHTAYIGNSLDGHLYKVDLQAMQVLRGAANPITLTASFTFISDVAYTPDGSWVLATSFNTDELYVVDPATDEVNPGPYPGPFSLSIDPHLLAGCANVEVAPRAGSSGKCDVYVLLGVANAIARVELF